MSTSDMDRVLRIAGAWVVLGLLVEAVTLVWQHPLAFVVFAGAGLTLVVIGMAYYLWSLAHRRA